MAKGAYIGVDGVARKVKGAYIGVDGVTRKVVSGYIGVDGMAKQFLVDEQSVVGQQWIFTNTDAIETFVVPDTGTYTIEMHGGGGGAGGGSSVTARNDRLIGSGGGGGGSGEIYTAILKRGESYDITIGKAGTQGSDYLDKNYGYNTGGNGTAGGITSFGTLYSIAGGGGGTGGGHYKSNNAIYRQIPYGGSSNGSLGKAGSTGTNTKGFVTHASVTVNGAAGGTGGSTLGSYGKGGTSAKVGAWNANPIFSGGSAAVQGAIIITRIA